VWKVTEKEKSIISNVKQLKLDYPMFFRTIIGFIIFSFIIPICIWFLYLIGHYIIIIPTDFSAGELLAYWGAILSFMSTSFLGILVLWQNIKANNISNRLSLIEKKRFKLDLQPFVLVSEWKVQNIYLKDVYQMPKDLYIQIAPFDESLQSVSTLRLTFINTSNTYTIVNYLTAKVYNNYADDDSLVDEWTNATVNQPNGRLYLQSGEKKDIVFYCSYEKMESFTGKRIRLELGLSNRYDEVYKETFEVIFISLTGTNVNGWYVNLNPQKYKIERYDKELKKFVFECEEKE
jgi:hypothetical protein